MNCGSGAFVGHCFFVNFQIPYIFPDDDEEGTYKLLKEMYKNWQSDIFPYKFNVEQYSRKKQSEQLAKIFEEQIK